MSWHDYGVAWAKSAWANISGIARAISETINTTYRNGLVAPRPRDPLAIDLDGDGLETVGIGAVPIVFDHNADGIRTGTGWLRSDDAWLVLDRDANGSIDTGRELFGVDTQITNADGSVRTAADGFEALRTLDANADGVFNASDAAFSQVRLWRDLNQDGISQAGELSTLAEQGIASIALNPSTGTINLGNGNTITGTATVTRNNGSTTQIDSVAVGADSTAGNLNLADNPFYREFSTPVMLSAAALALPEMGGSGVVRDLREAMSLGNGAAAGLVAAVQAFSSATTRDAQRGSLDELLRQWAGTEAIADRFSIEPVGQETRRFVVNGSSDAALQAQLNRIIPVLEVFNAATVDQGGWVATLSTENGQTIRTYTMASQQATLMLASYDSLRESVYSALVVQTRLKPYLDAVELAIDANGVRFDASAAIALMQAKASTDAYNAVADLLDLKKYADPTLAAVGWQAYETLSGVLQSATITPEIQALLTAERIVVLGPADTNYQVTNPAGAIVLGNAGANVLTGIANASDKLFGFGGNDTLIASGNGDTLDGGAGDDTLTVGGDPYVNGTTFIGGAGNDSLNGGYYGDTYAFNAGDGVDTINDYSPWGGYNADTLRFGPGIAPANVSATRSGNNMVFTVGSAGDQITVTNWFADGGGVNRIEQITFDDGSTWTAAQASTLALDTVNTGTASADALTGTFYYAETLRGLGGNDTLIASGNGDTLDGGAGDDMLTVGSDPYVSGTTFIGGTGNDTLNGGFYGDTYVFNLGDGVDTINDYSPWGGYYADTLRFGPGIAPASVSAIRSGNNLVFTVGSAGDQITVTNWFADGGGTNRIEQIVFDDGTRWSADQASTLALTAINTGTASADTLTGTFYYADTLQGLGGNDTLVASGNGDTLDGGAGDDTLTVGADPYASGTTFIGGIGNDSLNGGFYGDTYVFNAGDGVDTINDYSPWGGYYADTLRFGPGIASANVTATRSGNNLVFTVGSAGDQITVTNWFADGGGTNRIEQIVFDDGTRWSADQASTLALTAINTGTASADTLTGTFYYAETLRGLGGNDILTTSGSGDTLDGGAGDDTLTVGGDPYVSGTTFIGGTGNDTLNGGFYGDTYVFNLGDGSDTINDYSPWGGYYADTLRFGPGIASANVTATRSGNNLVFTVGSSGDQITVTNWFADGGGTNRIEQIVFGDGNIWSADQASTLALTAINTGTAGTDTLTGTFYYADTLRGLSGNDILTTSGSGDTLDGGAGDDTLTVGGDPYVSGTTFIGGAGNDSLNGGYYGDTYIFNAGDGVDTINDYSPWGGYYADTLRFGAGIAPANVTATRSGNNLVFTVGTGGDQVTVSNWFADGGGTNRIEQAIFDDCSTWTAAQVSTLALTTVNTGTASADTLTGTFYYADTLQGLGGNDTLVASGNGDTLDGGAGDDTLTVGGDPYVSSTTFIGGTGSDSLNGGYYGDIYVFNLGDGADTINDYSPWGGYYADTLRFGPGIASANVTATRSGNNLVFTVGSAGDQITVTNWFADGGGTNRIEQIVFDDGNTWDAARVEAAVATPLSGTIVTETLTGTAAADSITAQDGNDTLDGLAGHDWLDGGLGNDTMRGGAGDDVYVVDSATDVVTELVNEGRDSVRSSVTLTLAANVEELVLTGTTAINGTGNALDNVLYGNDAANVLAGGAGNDRYYVGTGDSVTEATNAGTDTVVSTVTWTLGSNTENLVLVGTAAINGTGNSLANVLTGNAAANTLNGGTGADTLVGGAGDDIYTVDNIGDVVTELDGEGADLVNSSITYTLGANVEKLTLTGSTAINGTGNTLDNVLTGNSANNTLAGGAGNDTLNGGTGDDTMLGGAGNDTYVVNVATDVVTELANEGVDTVQSAVAWTLGDHVENLTLTGSAAVGATGNALNNVLTGNGGANTLTGGLGNDTLDGGTGNDTMLGGAGDDIYVVNASGDVTTENAAEGVDTVRSSVTRTLGAHLENLSLLGTTAINATGNELANVLTGNSANNTLTGNAGNDTLDGGAGADVLAGGTGNDTYVMGRGYGAETLQENDATAGNADVMQFLSGVSTDQIWLRQVSNNLEVSIIGGTDKVTLTNWYLGNQYHVEQFRTADGHTLLDSSVQNLVNAMAAFAPPAAGQTTLPANYQAALAPVLASSWGG